MIATSVTVTLAAWQFVLLILAAIVAFFVALFYQGRRDWVDKPHTEQLKKSLESKEEELRLVRQELREAHNALHAVRLFAGKALDAFSKSLTHKKGDEEQPVDGSVIAEWKQVADTFSAVLAMSYRDNELTQDLRQPIPRKKPVWSEHLERLVDLHRKELTYMGYRASRANLEVCAELLGRSPTPLQEDVRALLAHKKT